MHVDVSPSEVSSSIIWIALFCFLPLLILVRRQFANPRPRGCRRLGLSPGQSNLRDEFDPKYAEGVPSVHDNGRAWRVKALFTYPLKSCGGIELQASDVVPTGLAFDRQFVFAEHGADGWTCRTLRNAGFNRMALIQPEIWVPDPSAPDYDVALPEVQSQGVMVVSYPRLPPARWIGWCVRLGMALGVLQRRHQFNLPLRADSECRLVSVRIWKDKPLAYDYGAKLPASLHAYLGSDPTNTQLTLFRASSRHSREIFRNAPRKASLGFQPNTAFADAYPIHLLNLTSHRDVAARCAYAIPRLSIRRFRANIIIQGPAAFAEDHWKRIAVTGTEIYAACRAVRCRLPNVDPLTGERHPAEPDRALKAYRRIDDGDRTNACLGLQLVPAREEFRVCVGDVVRVLETGEHRYIKMLAPGERVEGV
ncbi:Molybdenum cofactor sulfurase C-terminal [Penicillium alfredii]|uniref:Molybdenum cofactor sulfurase C-terminal n=1 Tax=Penicillium alfredii TaxID=1506179 RepID=A0A9W9JTI1_9EURO|nr:Molybdenum cofactor sulfurase C-terminal [Penicillium alfredii]KAJ5081313.1 Molybdenum cofactor sulfurase C-terminal [Penicillium alfredii]